MTWRNNMDIAHDEYQANAAWADAHLFCDQCDDLIGPMQSREDYTREPVYCRSCLASLQEDAEMGANWAWEEAMAWMMAAAQREDEWRTLQQMEAV